MTSRRSNSIISKMCITKINQKPAKTKELKKQGKRAESWLFYACRLINKQINFVFWKHTATTINFNTPKATTLSFRNIVKGVWELGFRVWIGEFPITALFSKHGNKQGSILKPSKSKTSKQEASVGTTTKATKATEKASSVSKTLGKQSKIPVDPCQRCNHRKRDKNTWSPKAKPAREEPQLKRQQKLQKQLKSQCR